MAQNVQVRGTRSDHLAIVEAQVIHVWRNMRQLGEGGLAVPLPGQIGHRVGFFVREYGSHEQAQRLLGGIPSNDIVDLRVGDQLLVVV